MLLVIAIMVVYIVLGILYESYIHPLTILSGLPSAGFGALLTLVIFRMDLNIYAFVGMIMLIGIVEKNAIMQIDFALDAERQGSTPEQAIYQGCLIRFRPIMMTTMAALLGAVPIALGYGAGGEARQPLGLVVVGGLLFSQLVTLYLTPVVLHLHGAGAGVAEEPPARVGDGAGRGHPEPLIRRSAGLQACTTCSRVIESPARAAPGASRDLRRGRCASCGPSPSRPPPTALAPA